MEPLKLLLLLLLEKSTILLTTAIRPMTTHGRNGLPVGENERGDDEMDRPRELNLVFFFFNLPSSTTRTLRPTKCRRRRRRRRRDHLPSLPTLYPASIPVPLHTTTIRRRALDESPPPSPFFRAAAWEAVSRTFQRHFTSEAINSRSQLFYHTTRICFFALHPDLQYLEAR